jgi:hypothetical protein
MSPLAPPRPATEEVGRTPFNAAQRLRLEASDGPSKAIALRSPSSKISAAFARDAIAASRVERADERRDLRDDPNSRACRTRANLFPGNSSSNKSDFYSDSDDKRAINRVSSFIRARRPKLARQ